MKKYDDNEQSTLLQATVKLLEKSEKRPHEIFAETGLPFHWIQSLMKGKTPNPSVNRVQYLYEYLTNQKLDF